jgi:hypothetical protein
MKPQGNHRGSETQRTRGERSPLWLYASVIAFLHSFHPLRVVRNAMEPIWTLTPRSS